MKMTDIIKKVKEIVMRNPHKEHIDAVGRIKHAMGKGNYHDKNMG